MTPPRNTPRAEVCAAARDLVDCLDGGGIANVDDAIDELAGRIDAWRADAPADPDLEEIIRRARALVAYVDGGGKVVSTALAVKLGEILDLWRDGAVAAITRR